VTGVGKDKHLKGIACSLQSSSRLVYMQSLLQLWTAASLLLICLWRPAAADPPVPQPTDPSSGFCQFDVGFGLYDLSALNVNAALCCFLRRSWCQCRNSANKFCPPTWALCICHRARRYGLQIAQPFAASIRMGAGGQAVASRRE
jgi:hypothetical protein